MNSLPPTEGHYPLDRKHDKDNKEEPADAGLYRNMSVNDGRIIADDQTQHEKPFTILSALGIGYGTTNSAVGVLVVLGSTIPFGGSPLMFWGFLLMAFVGLANAVSLGELASGNPHPGGQYVWAGQLATPRLRPVLSFSTAVMNWIGAVSTGASATLAVPVGVCSIISLLDPTFVYKPWMGFVGYQILNVLAVSAASFEHALPKIAQSLLVFTVLSMITVSIYLFAVSKEHVSAAYFFTSDYNISGWSKGVAFLIGMNGPNWTFAAIDLVVHIAEEIPQPRKNVPRSLVLTILVGLLSGLLVVLAILINLTDMEKNTDNTALAVIYRISGSKAAAAAFWILPLISTTGSVWGIHTWQSRLAWTLGSQGGLPFGSHIGRIAPAPFHTPLWALLLSSTATALLGCLYLGSVTAFNSLVSTGLILQNLSYAIPISLLLLNGRSNFEHGPFWYPKLGFLANIISLSWTLVSLIFYCFPYYIPVAAGDMNYTSAVIAGVMLFITISWFGYARKHYRPVS